MKQSQGKRAGRALPTVRTGAAGWLVALAGLFGCVAAQAQALVPSFWDSSCTGCHATPPTIAATGTSGGGSSEFGLSESWMSSANALMARANGAGPGIPAAAMTNLTLGDAGLVLSYLRQVRDGEVTTPSVSFANTVVLSTRTSSFSFTIRNYRAEALTYSLATTGGNASEFTVQSHTATGTGCSAGNVPAAASPSNVSACTVNLTVAFTPQAAGPRSTDLLVSRSGASLPQPPARSISLSGQAVLTNDGVVTSPPVSIADTFVLQTRTTSFSFTISNFRTEALTYSLASSGGNASEFTVQSHTATGTGCSAGSVPAAASAGAVRVCTVNLTVAFTPQAAGLRTTDLLISMVGTSAPPPPIRKIQLSAQALLANDGVVTSPPVAIADTVVLQTRTTSFSFTISNFRTEALTYSLASSGGNASEFTVQSHTATGSGCSAGIVPKAPSPGAVSVCTVNLTVAFTPQAAGQRSTALLVSMLGTTAPPPPTRTIPLSAQAVLSADGVVSAPPVSIADTVVLQTRTTSISFTISNFRTEALTYSLTSSGGNASEFTVQSHAATGTGCSAGNVPKAPSPGAVSVCTVNLTLAFTPQAAGLRSTALLVSMAGTTAPPPPTHTIPLSAQALLPIALSSTSLTPSALVGTASTVSVNVTNQSSAQVTLNGLPFSGPRQADYSLDGSSACTAGLTLGAGQSCMLVIKFEPLSGSPSPRVAALAISHSAFGSPQSVSLSGAVVNAPLIELSAAALAFSDTQLNRNSTQTVTVRNAGSLGLVFNNIGVSGAAASEFQASGTCTTSVPVLPNASCTVVMTFSPATLGLRNATLAISSNADNAPNASVPLTGIGVDIQAPLVELSPKLLPANAAAGIDFGAQTLGGLYPSRVMNLRNTGNADLLIASISVDGATFAMSSSAPCPSTLSPGDTCEIQLAFSPAAANTDYAGALRITNNAVGSPHSAALLGRGVAWAVPVLAWTPAATALDFGLVSAGSVSATQSLTLVNRGPGGVIVKTINAVGVDAASFAAAGTCVVDQPLYEGDSCQVDVRFSPGSAGLKSAAVQFAGSTANTPPAFSLPPVVSLAGTGLAGPNPLNLPILAPTPASLSFGSTRTGEQSTALDVTLSASGAGVLRVTAMSVDGPFALQTKTCPALPLTLEGGSSCVVTLSFRPQAQGSASGTLRITTDATPSVREIALAGSGEGRPDLSSGGCSLASGDGPTDPTLWAMVVAAIAAILYRRRVRRMRTTSGPTGGRT